MEPQNIHTSLLSKQQLVQNNQSKLQQASQISSNQITNPNNNESQIKVKKRMTSYKNPPSLYKNTINKIFCHYYPIQLNSTLDTKCQAQLGFLFIGGLGVINQQTLKKYQIKAILTVLDYKKYDKQNIAQKIQDLNQVQQHQYIDMPQDHQNIAPYLDHSYDFIIDILSHGLNLLVHSNEGISRSPTIVINYLMRKYKIKFQQAYKIVKQRKAQIQIKPILLEQLKKLKY